MAQVHIRRCAAALASLSLFLAACGPTVPPPAPTNPPPPVAARPTEAPRPAAPALAPPPGAAPAADLPVPSPKPGAAPAPPAAAPAGPSAPLVIATLTNLSRTLHPYPDSASYTASWIDVATLIWGGGEGGGGLLAFDWQTLAYVPALAREMPHVSADGKTYTFTLRDDIKWSDGSPITVDDFLFAWDNASKKENDFVGLDQLEEIASVKAVDATSLEMVLQEALSHDVAFGTLNLITPVPKKVWDGKPWNDPTANPEIFNPSVVLGPYRVTEFRIGERGVFTAIDTYYKGRPRIPSVEILPAQQPNVAYEMLRSGRANWAPGIPPAQYAEAKANPDLDMKEWTAGNAVYRVLEFNLARPFLADRKVREALSRAVNRADVLDIAEQGLATPQYSFLTPTNTRWYNPNVDKYDFDMNRAKQLLAEAGYTPQNGRISRDGQPVRLEVLFPTSSAPRARIAAYMQQQYRELGIDVDVRGLDFNAYTEAVQVRKAFDISLGTYGGGSLDPDLGPKPQLITGGPQNVTGYSNPQVDQLFRQGASELDDARRKQTYDQIQQLVNADLPSHYLYAVNSFSPMSKKVQGVTPNKGDRLDYNDAILTWSVADGAR